MSPANPASMGPQPWELRKRIWRLHVFISHDGFNGAAALGAAETGLEPHRDHAARASMGPQPWELRKQPESRVCA